MQTGESWFHISTPLGIEPGSLMTRSNRVDHWTSGTVYECSEIVGSLQAPPSSRYVSCEAGRRTLRQVWNRDRRAVWDQVGLWHCQHDSLVKVLDKSCRRRGHNDQSRWGHQCSETMLIGESWFHVSTPPGDWTWVPHDRKQTGGPLDQWNCVWMQWNCRLSTRVSFF